MKILIINGPNLNMLGKREEIFYGRETFEDILKYLRNSFPKFELDYFQSNSEGEIIDKLQDLDEFNGLIINPGGFSHYSIAILDALKIIEIPCIEVHLSNIQAREDFRKHSLTAQACTGVISGLGKEAYRLAIEWFKVMDFKKIGFV